MLSTAGFTEMSRRSHKDFRSEGSIIAITLRPMTSEFPLLVQLVSLQATWTDGDRRDLPSVFLENTAVLGTVNLISRTSSSEAMVGSSSDNLML